MSNLPVNPYFDPDPRWHFNSLYTLCAISVIIFIGLVYIILKHSPNAVTKTFKHLLIGHMTTALLFELNVTVLCPMLIYLPFVAVEGKGLLTYLGVGIDHQVVMVLTSLVAGLSAVVPLFYYRMRCLLPDGHFFNRPVVHYSINLFLYILFYIQPIPTLYLTVHYHDHGEVKRYYETIFNLTFPNLYSPQVQAIRVRTNPWAIIAAGGGMAICSVLTTTIILGCTYMSYQALKRATNSLSITARKHHITLLKSLVAMIFVLVVDTAMIVPFFTYLVVFNSYRIDIAYAVIIFTATLMPTIMTIYCATYTPYRQFILGKMRRVIRWKASTQIRPYLSGATSTSGLAS